MTGHTSCWLNVTSKQIPTVLPWMEGWKEEEMDRVGFSGHHKAGNSLEETNKRGKDELEGWNERKEE